MLRQRLRTRRSPTRFLRIVGRLLVLALAAALIWYGAMLVALAAKVSPSTVNDLSAYRTAYNSAAQLTPQDITPTTRVIVGASGAVAFLVFGFLALRELPRPRLARQDLSLEGDEHGSVVVEPRAIERAAEVAAESEPGIAQATGRYETQEIAVDVTVREVEGLEDTLHGAQRAVRGALEQAGLPVLPVTLTLSGFDSNR